MKKAVFNFLFFFIILIQANSQIGNKINLKQLKRFEDRCDNSGWIRILNMETKKWGFVDEDSILRIPFIYDFVNPLDSSGLALAKLNGKQGFIDEHNAAIIPFEYADLGLFTLGLASAKKDQKYGYINRNNELIIPYQFEKKSGFKPNGLAKVSIDKKLGFINLKGDVVVPLFYEDASIKKDASVVSVKKNGNWAVFTNKGEQLTDFVYESFDKNDHWFPFSVNGPVLVRKDAEMGYLNSKFEMVVPFGKYLSAEPFNENHLAIVESKNYLYGIIDTLGNYVLPCKFDQLTHPNRYSYELYEFLYKVDGKWGILNEKAEMVFGGCITEPIWGKRSFPDKKYQNVFIVKNDHQKFGLINGNGQALIPFIYDSLQLMDNNSQWVLAKKDGNYGIVNAKNEVVHPFEFNAIDWYRFRQFYVAGINGKYGILNRKLEEIIPYKYELLDPIFKTNNQNIIAQKNGKRGIIDMNEEVIVPFQYDSISNWVEYGPEDFFVSNEGKFGIISKTGKVRIPLVYDEIDLPLGEFMIASKNQKYGVIDWNNHVLIPFLYDNLHTNLGPFGLYDDKPLVFCGKKDETFILLDEKGKVLNPSMTKDELKEWGFYWWFYPEEFRKESGLGAFPEPLSLDSILNLLE